MTLPAVLFAGLISSLLGITYHLIRDGGFGRLLLYLILAWGGFAAGYFGSGSLTWSLLPLGPIDYGFSLFGSLAFLLIGDWITRIRIPADPFPDEENEV